MRPSAFLLPLLAVLVGCDGPPAPETRTNEERIEALGLHREPLPGTDNPILSLKEPLESFLKETRDDFQTDADLPSFLDFQVTPETSKRCWALQQTLRETINRGPGRIPDPTADPDGFNVFFIIQARRANGALAAKSLADGNPAGAAFHLAFTFEVADYIFSCDPPLLAYSFAVHLKKQTFDDLLRLYQAAPGPELLAQITTICRNSRFKTSYLESVLKTEARLGIDAYKRFPDYIREESAKYKSLWSLFYEPPLAECSIDQLVAMNYDADESLFLLLDGSETALQQVGLGTPLADWPERLHSFPEPKPLAYYQSAPNGLYEIFEDCSRPNPRLIAMVVHQTLDATVEVTLAWLRAEADGISVNSLDALVPRYLDRVPADPCDGKPLRCIPGKRLIYSVGIDLKDDGGRAEPDPDAKDQSLLDRPFHIPKITP